MISISSRLRIEAGAVEDGQYVQAGVLVDKLRRRQVEGQEQFVRPVARRFRRLTQHQLRQRADDAALFGDRDEGGRRHDAKVAVGPPRQRLETDDTAILQVDDRLEMRLDLSRRHGAAQRLLDTGHALGGLFHLARIDDNPAAAGAFRLVERRFRLVQ